ncbi:hypothetical protein BJV74DRAFT_859293, partial [Russula compacta]
YGPKDAGGGGITRRKPSGSTRARIAEQSGHGCMALDESAEASRLAVAGAVR